MCYLFQLDYCSMFFLYGVTFYILPEKQRTWVKINTWWYRKVPRAAH